MEIGLRRELLTYGTTLLVLKGLESRHHLVALKVGRGRAASVSAVSAEIRRLQNKDLRDQRYAEQLPDLLADLGQLTSLPYRNRTELLSNIVGQVYRGMHDTMSAEGAYFQKFRDCLKQKAGATHRRAPDFEMKMQHLSELLSEGEYYSIGPAQLRGDSMIFQVLALNPGRRMYVQRAAHMSNDDAVLSSTPACDFFVGCRVHRFPTLFWLHKFT